MITKFNIKNKYRGWSITFHFFGWNIKTERICLRKKAVNYKIEWGRGWEK
jgi:hypothetical protein